LYNVEFALTKLHDYDEDCWQCCIHDEG